ncbi:MAG: prolyl oligopeptidase family serine peptidase [Pseudomonadota bacterium]
MRKHLGHRLAAVLVSVLGFTACGDSRVVASLPTAPPGGGGSNGAMPLAEVALPKSCSSVEGATLRPKPSAVPAGCIAQSWLAGSTALCQGRHIYRDYLYDDHGADNGQPLVSLDGPAGEATYAEGTDNTADLVNLQLWADGDRLRIRGELNTLFAVGNSVLALAIDTDGNATTGGGTWCDLGIISTGWELLQAFRQGDPDTNVIEGSIPMPAGSRWRLQAVVAQADGTVMNVAYRGIDEQARCLQTSTATTSTAGCLFEDHQSAALAEGDISAFGETIDVADLRNGSSRAATAITPGLHSRVYTSAFTLPPGEGIGAIPGRGDAGDVPSSAQEFVFFGKYQPYALYMPTAGSAPYPMQVLFHGSGANHTSLMDQPNIQLEFGEQFGRILVSPLARGPDGYGSDISERDQLDVMADVEANFPIDLERVIASGYSQGGYVTYRMASLYPQRFAGFVSWVGFTGDDFNGVPGGAVSATAGAVGNMIDFVGNLRHIPGSMIYAGADELVQIPSARAIQQTFAATDNVYKWYLHPAAEHLTFALLDEWAKEATDSANFKRVVNPARVTYRHDPTLGNAEYGIRHDRAYWVSGIVNRTVGADHFAEVYSDIDLINRSCGGSVPVSAAANNVGQSPLPWASEERNATGSSTPFAAENLLEGTLVNIASLNIDASATCNAGKPLRYVITTDGPAELRLSDGRRIALTAAGEHRGQL